MLLKDLAKVWISRNNPTNNYGEYSTNWELIGTAFLNIQQDVNELDRKSSGEIDYGIYKARTTRDYGIKTGDGISTKNISTSEEFIPDYRVLDITKIGSTYMYRLEAYNGD